MHWTHKDIIDYYHTNEFGYKLWGPNMHYGFWEKGIRTQRAAALNFNRMVAKTAGITRDDHVLDCGCGVGGCSIYLAKTIGCKVTGITITPRQVALATKNAEKAGVAHLVDFQEMNYESTTFEDGRFSVVWGLESICYAESTKNFLKEAFRVLNDTGRVVVADGFAGREYYEGRNARLMQRWLDGWIVNFLDTPATFARFAREIGFTKTAYQDVTSYVWPSSVIMLLVSLPFLPLHVIDYFFRIKSYPTDACWNQFFALRKKLWEYGIFLAAKNG